MQVVLNHYSLICWWCKSFHRCVFLCHCWKEDPPQQLILKSKPQETREAHGDIFRKQFLFVVILMHHPTSALNQHSRIGKCFLVIMDSCIFHFRMAQSIMTLCKIRFEETQKQKINFQILLCHESNSSVVSYKSLHIFKKYIFIKWAFKLVYQNNF